MDSALVVSQIVLVAGCITAKVTLEFLFFGLVVMSFFMPVQPCFTLEDLKAQLTLPLLCPAQDHAESSCASYKRWH